MPTRGQASEAELDLLFREARSQNSWTPEAVSEQLLRQVYDLAKWGPTAVNSTPARFVFVISKRPKKNCARPWRPTMSTRPWPPR